MRVLLAAPFLMKDATLDALSQAYPIAWLSNISIITSITGNIQGTLLTQVSNQSIGNPNIAITRWATITTLNINGALSSLSSLTIPCQWLRFSYAYISGNGTITVEIEGQGE